MRPHTKTEVYLLITIAMLLINLGITLARW
jgi:hypothetical protein